MTQKVSSLAIDINVTGATQASAALTDVEKKGKKAADSLEEMGAKALRAKLGFAALAAGALAMATEYQNIYERVKLFEASAAGAAETQARLVRLAIDQRSNLSDVARIYSRLSLVSAEIGANQAEVLRVTRAVAATFRISGANAQEAAASGTQLAQAIGSGRLAGDELKSVMENNLSLAQAIAAGMGVTVGALKQMGAEGRLTSKEVFAALLSQSDSLAMKSEGMSTTLSSGFATLRTGMTAFVGQLDRALNITNSIGEAFAKLGAALASEDGVIGALFGALRMLSEGVDGAIMILRNDVDGILRLTPEGRGQLASRADAIGNPMFRAGGGIPGANGFGGGFASFGDTGLSRLQGIGIGEFRTFGSSQNGEGMAIPGAPRASSGDTASRAAGLLNVSPVNSGRRGGLARLTLASQLGSQRGRRLSGVDVGIEDSIALIAANMEQVFAPIQARVQSLGTVLADSLANGITAAVQSGSISEGFKELGRTMLGGLGAMIRDFGIKALVASQFMLNLLKSFASLNPVAGAAAATGLIALGSVMVGLAGRGARASFGTTNTGINRGAATSSTFTERGSIALPSSIFGSATPASGISGNVAAAGNMVTVNATIIGPNDPNAQRQMQELMKRASARGAV